MPDQQSARACREQSDQRHGHSAGSNLLSLAATRVEAVVLFLALSVVALSAVRLEAFEAFVEFAEGHESWELDEIALVTFFAGIFAIGLLLLRARDLRRQILEREEAERRASALARHDALTGLPNRRVFEDALSAALNAPRAAGALLLIDLDRFKAVNDVYGHSAGDELLIDVAAKLKEIVDPGDVVARLGGDEFGCVITSCHEPEDLAVLASHIAHAISQPLTVTAGVLHTGATVGIARFPGDGKEPVELLRAADIALYQGKREGRATFRFFDPLLDDALAQRVQLERELRSALENGEVEPFFQPLIHLRTGEIVGFEALARWLHPQRGTIAPDVFIPIAEDLGVINQLTEMLLASACGTALTWPERTKLSINIAPVQLKDPWFAARLLAILSKAGLAPSRLIIEVTESTIIQEYEAASANLRSFRNSGVSIALDDFGKGYSSLSYLHKFKFDHIKIDGSFVISLEEAENKKIVAAVLGLGRALEMSVTAEGIESASAARELRSLGCEFGQGNLLGKPVPAVQTLRCIRDCSGGQDKVRRSAR